MKKRTNLQKQYWLDSELTQMLEFRRLHILDKIKAVSDMQNLAAFLQKKHHRTNKQPGQ